MKLGFLYRFYKSKKLRPRNFLFKPIKRRLKLELARTYRSAIPLLGKVRFIGVTGSCGKTTTTELIATILSKEGQVQKSSYANTIDYIADTILTVLPRHRFCVIEVSGHRPRAVEKSAKLLHPHVAVITHIGQDHYGNYRNLESTAAEKCKLVEALPADGVAVLNTDDPYVFDMRERTKAQVITYGLSTNAMVRGENVSCAWPRLMSLEVCYAEKRFHIQTQLLGEHWAYAVLAALATGIALDVPLERAIQAVKTFAPLPTRMSSYKTPDGVTFIRDEQKAPLWAIPVCLDFMKKAKAERKIIVMGSISDTPKGFYHRYRTVIQQATDIVDKMVFVGDHAYSALRMRANPEDNRITALSTVYELNSFLSKYLKPGDLVLLKGSLPSDHLERIVLSQTNDIACWREKCGKHRLCSDCRYQHSPFVPTDTVNVS